jgi:hypothetical protein
MPPDQEDLNRQLEALERYVTDLTEQRKRAKEAGPQPAPESRRPPTRWLLVTGLLVVVALVGGLFVGAAAWSDDRPAAARTDGAGTPSANPSADRAGTAAAVASPACKTAVDRANTMLAVAVELQRTLAEYGRIVNDPANDGLSSRELRDKAAPALQTGASESARLDRALADYRQVVDRCKLSTP